MKKRTNLKPFEDMKTIDEKESFLGAFSIKEASDSDK